MVKNYINLNKEALLNLKPKNNSIVYLFITFIILILIVLCKYKIYDTYSYIGVYQNGEIIINVPIDDISKLMSSDYIKVDEKTYKFEVIKISNIEYDKYLKQNYQTVFICTSKNYIENMSLNIKFYNNKQRVIKKIIHLLK